MPPTTQEENINDKLQRTWDYMVQQEIWKEFWGLPNSQKIAMEMMLFAHSIRYEDIELIKRMRPLEDQGDNEINNSIAKIIISYIDTIITKLEKGE